MVLANPKCLPYPVFTLQKAIIDLLEKGNNKLGPSSSELKLSSTKPAAILVVGVNGAGKVCVCVCVCVI